ncbi:MAG: cupin domain-containing protein [Desulfocapsaceae bacterium]|jgi:quercetin dioxygenase-like cupin family protein|nr:cupin domain-containing protein [Desulfocapsaceae bacterium]
MAAVKEAAVVKEEIADKRSRYLTHSDNLMMVVIDFNDGPTSEPDPPHDHPHEQVSYVAAGEVVLVLGKEQTKLGPGDMFVVPPHVPHSVQLLTKHARLVDTFTPLREDFL